MTTQPIDMQWSALAEPFPDDEVKMRPGPGNMQFRYVDARAVAQRLDDVLTPAGWDFTCSVIPGSDVVKGTLCIGGSVREDHGYPNSDRDEEPIKAATSDALKRCAVLFGIGRHLYDDNRPHTAPRPVVAQSPAHTRTAPPRSSTTVPDDEGVDWDSLNSAPPRILRSTVPLSEGEGLCPAHNVPWVLKPAGTSKSTGKDYGPFFTCGAAGPPWCTEKPTKQWVEAHHP